MANLQKQTINLTVNALQSESVIARMSALKALSSYKKLGILDTDAPVDEISSLLIHDDEDLRCEAALTLGVLGDERAVRPLICALKDSDEIVRNHAALALGEIGGEDAVKPLIEAMGEPESEWMVDDDEDYNWDPQWDMQLHTVQALAKIGDPRGVAPIIHLLVEEEAIDMADTIMKALSQIADDKAKAALLNFLKDDSYLFRRHSANALVDLKGEDISSALMDALLDTDPGVRIASARALAKKKEPAAIISIIMLLRDEDASVRGEVSTILSGVDNKNIATHILPLLHDADKNTRKTAVEVLGNIKESKAVDKLILELKNNTCEYKRSVAKALGAIGANEAIMPLTKMAKSETENVEDRIEAIRAIGLIAPDGYVDILKEIAQDPDINIYFNAMLTLTDIGSVEAVEALIETIEVAPPPGEEALESDEEMVTKETSGERAGDIKPSPDETVETVEEPEEENEDWGQGIERKELAIKLLGEMQNDGISLALWRVYEDGAPDLKNVALEALAVQGDPDVASHFLEPLESDKRDTRLLALGGLDKISQLTGDVANKVVEVALKDPDTHCRQSATTILANLGEKIAENGLMLAMDDESLVVRKEAVKGLGRYKNEKVFERLLKALLDYGNFGHLRSEVALSLGAVDFDKAETKLANILMDEEEIVNHWVALEALVDISSASVALAKDIA